MAPAGRTERNSLTLLSIGLGGDLNELNLLKRKKILITGAAGLFGPHLVKAFSALGQVIELGRTTGTIFCDLTETNQTNTAISSIEPALTIHCAALTDVDACEDAPDEATGQNNGIFNLIRGSRI